MHGSKRRHTEGLSLGASFVLTVLLNIQEAKLVLFADDTNLSITGKDECVLQHKIAKVMTEVETWFQKNNLIINTGKIMSFHSKQMRLPSGPKVTFKNLEIAYKSELRLLGLCITENLKWDTHI
jgi:hypothetical protein